MLPGQLLERIGHDDSGFSSGNSGEYVLPEYGPESHYLDVTNRGYFRALVVLRHYFKEVSEYYFGVVQRAKNVDLFMLTPSISSPMGPGSDSEGIPIQFGGLTTYLVDSSQFGFEPIVMNGIDKVYCYLPSMRGEDFDERHLNQFYHCEAEIRGTLAELIPIIEGYVQHLSMYLLGMPNIIDRISGDPIQTKLGLQKLIDTAAFPRITFDTAVETLERNGSGEHVNHTASGRDIRAQGELNLLKFIHADTPVWVCGYDRDRVPFYQKPDPLNTERVINADLVFPPLVEGAFGGEVIGSGQRQDDAEEMCTSMGRQGVEPSPYEWYINLRRQPGYQVTSGFGLGVERFLAWVLCRSDIKDVILYPRLKGVVTHP